MHHTSIGTIGKLCVSLGLVSLSPTTMPWLLPAVVSATTIAIIATPIAVQASVLSTWEYDPSTQELEITVPGGTTPHYFLAAEPARIVLELPGTNIGTVTTEQSYGGAVRQIRVAQFAPGVTRIVLELAPGTVLAPGHAELQQVNGSNSSDRWVLRPLLASGGTTATASPPPTSPTAPSSAPSTPTPQDSATAATSASNAASSAASNSAFNGLPPLEPGATEIPVESTPASPDAAPSPPPQASAVASAVPHSSTSSQPDTSENSPNTPSENPFQPRTNTFTVPVPEAEQEEATPARHRHRSRHSSGSTPSDAPENTATENAETAGESATASHPAPSIPDPVPSIPDTSIPDTSFPAPNLAAESDRIQEEAAQETAQREANTVAQSTTLPFPEPPSSEATAAAAPPPPPMLPPAELPSAPAASAPNQSLPFNIPPVTAPAATQPPLQSSETVPASPSSIAPTVPEPPPVPSSVPSSSAPSTPLPAADVPPPSPVSPHSDASPNAISSEATVADAVTPGSATSGSIAPDSIAPDSIAPGSTVPDSTTTVPSAPSPDRPAPAINPPTAIEQPTPSPVRPSTVTAPPADAAPPTSAVNRSIDFGQPIPQSAFGHIPQIAAEVPTSGSPEIATNNVRIPSGTTLSLRYPGSEILTLSAGQSRQEVMVLAEAVKDASGTVILPEGSYVIGRFESKDNGSQFITQAISLQGRNVMLHAQSDTLSSNRELSQNHLLQNSALGVAAGLVLGGITGIGLIPAIATGAATSAATTYVTAPQATLIQPDQVVEVRLIEDLTGIN